MEATASRLLDVESHVVSLRRPSLADPGFSFGGTRSSAEGASIEAPQAPRGGGVWATRPTLSPIGKSLGGGCEPSPENFWIFLPRNGTFFRAF